MFMGNPVPVQDWDYDQSVPKLDAGTVVNLFRATYSEAPTQLD